LLVFDAVRIPRNQQSKYTGRSQYHKIKNKRLVGNRLKTVFHCEHLLYWGEVKGILTASKQAFEGGMQHSVANVIPPFEKLLQLAGQHTEGLKPECEACALALHKSINCVD